MDISRPDQTGPRAAPRVIVPLVILVLCATAFYLTTTFDRVPPILKRGIQPSDFPQLVILLIAALALWLALRDREPAPQRLPATVYITMGLLIGFSVLALVDLFIALGAFAVAMSAVWGERRAWALALVGLVVPVAVFFLFDIVFEIRFPRGVLTNLWYG